MAKIKNFNIANVNQIVEELDLSNVNQSDMASLSSRWLQYGVITYNKGDKTGKLELLMGGKAYSFPSFPIDVWNQMKESESAGKVLWDTVWFGKRTKSVGLTGLEKSSILKEKLRRKQAKYHKKLYQRRQQTLRAVKTRQMKRLGTTKKQRKQRTQRRR